MLPENFRGYPPIAAPLQVRDGSTSSGITQKAPALDGFAQMCMMLARAPSQRQHYVQGNGRTSQEWTELLLDSAQFCFALSPYFMRTRSDNTQDALHDRHGEDDRGREGCEMNQLVFLMGFLTRMALTMQLHRTTTIAPMICPRSRRRCESEYG